jgi:hypothetical protein
MASAEKATTAREPEIYPLESISVAGTQIFLPPAKTENQPPISTDTRSIYQKGSEFRPDELATAQLENPSDATPLAETNGLSNTEDTTKQAADVSERVLAHKACELKIRQKAIFKECTDSTKDDKWNVRRFEQLSFISLYNLHLEIMEFEAEVVAAEGMMSQDRRERLRTLLKDYSDAMRNIEYLTKFPSQRFDDAFNRSGRVFSYLRPKMSDNFDYCSFQATSPAGDQVRSILQKILPARVVLSDASLFYQLYRRRINGAPLNLP